MVLVTTLSKKVRSWLTRKTGALVLLQQVFQQLQGFDVQVIGWLVQHQNVGRAGKQAGQQQAVALAAGQ